MAQKILIDHSEVRSWIIEHGGTPAYIRDESEIEGVENPNMLYISFDPMDSNFKEISWNEFFERFDDESLALVVHDEDLEPPDFDLIDKDAAMMDDNLSVDLDLPDSDDDDGHKENMYSRGFSQGETDL